MVEQQLIAWLCDKVEKSDDSDTSSWSDVCSLKIQSSEEEEYENHDDSLFFPLMQHLIGAKRRRNDNYLHVIDSWTDTKFKARLGVSRVTACRLIDNLKKSGNIASHTFGMKPLEPKLCFYIFLTFISNTETLTPIAARFDISISSAFRVIRKVTAWLITTLDETIKWPRRYDEVTNTCDLFISKIGIVNVLGVIDCTHIKIEKPKNGRDYCNAKGYSSIVLQATINANLQFTDIFCGEPGSSNCARVLKKSPLYNTAMQDKNSLFPHSTFLIGHSGYPPQSWLIPPFRDSKKITLEQKNFNIIHSNARKFCDGAFMMLKKRFRRLKRLNVYRNLSFITDTVVAACILHNYCSRENDYL